MSFRFWRRFRVAPGVTLNLSKSGISLSAGPRGAQATLGPRGGRTTVGIPGTGLFHTSTFADKKPARRGSDATPDDTSSVRPQDKLSLGFFERLVTPADEKALVEGCRALAEGQVEEALDHLSEAVHLADGAYLAGLLALKAGQTEDAVRYLTFAVEHTEDLGHHLSKYDIEIAVHLPITDNVSAHVGANLRGALLGLVEAYQAEGQTEDAIACPEQLRRLESDDIVVKLSLAELLFETTGGEDKSTCQRILRLAEGIENESEIHGALLLYKAKALVGLGLFDAARDVLTAILRRKKDRPDALLHAARYERTLVYEAQGHKRKARSEIEKLYASAPDYEDVATRLGLQ